MQVSPGILPGLFACRATCVPLRPGRCTVRDSLYSLYRPERLTSVADAAAYVNVSTRSIRRWISLGLIPGYRVGPRLIKVDLADLDRLAHRIPAAGGGGAGE